MISQYSLSFFNNLDIIIVEVLDLKEQFHKENILLVNIEYHKIQLDKLLEMKATKAKLEMTVITLEAHNQILQLDLDTFRITHDGELNILEAE